GLRVGRRIVVQCLGLVGYAMGASRTLGDTLERLGRYSRIVCEEVECRLTAAAESVTMVLHDHGTVAAAARPRVDARLAAGAALCRKLTAHGIVPTTVDLPYPCPPRLNEHRRSFGPALLRFGGRNAALVFSVTDLARAVRTGDETLAGHLDRLAAIMLTEL